MLVNKSIVIIRLKTFQNKSDSRAGAMRGEANPTGPFALNGQSSVIVYEIILIIYLFQQSM